MRFDAARRFKIIEDANGFITAEGVIATAGEKLVYRDGIETISENALFENMDEWEGLPLTLNHPNKLLNPSSVQKSQVGSVIKAWRKDNQLWARFKVTAKQALDAVRSGMRGLSAGYNALIDENKVQIGRQNNHLAIVRTGRSPSSGIRADERRDSYDLNGETTMLEIKFPNGKVIKLDCTEAEQQLMQDQVDALSARADTAEESLVKVSDFLSEHFDMEEEDMSKKLDMMKEKIAKMKKDGENVEKLQAQYDAMKEKYDKSKGKMDSGELSEIFDTHEKVLKLNPEIKIRTDDGEIKTSRDLAVEALDMKLDEKSDEYVAARLDMEIEGIDDDNVRHQRSDNQDPKKQTKLTVQQKADAKFYKGE